MEAIGNALNDSHTFTSSGWLVRRQVPDPSGGFGADPLPVLQLRTRAVPWPHLQVWYIISCMMHACSWDLWFVDYDFVYFRMVKPRIVLLIFVSGKVVLTGAKVRQEIYEAFDNIYPILKNFKKQWPGSGNPNKYKEQMKIASLYILTMCKYYYVNCCSTVLFFKYIVIPNVFRVVVMLMFWFSVSVLTDELWRVGGFYLFLILICQDVSRLDTWRPRGNWRWMRACV